MRPDLEASLTEDFLRSEYLANNKSAGDIGRLVGCGYKCVTRRLVRFGIEVRQPSKLRDLTGQKLGKWTVVKLAKGGKRVSWNCVCECGKTSVICAANLQSGGSRQCKTCAYEEAHGKHAKKARVGDLPWVLWNRIMGSATKRGIDFSISIERGWELFAEQKGLCALSGVEIGFGPTTARMSETTASFDRIRSGEGYVEGNVQWVHRTINYMKGNTPEDVFVDFCRQVAARSGFMS